MAASTVSDIGTLLEASRVFFTGAVAAPTSTNLIAAVVARSATPELTSARIVAHANATRVLLHARVLALLDAFLAFKRAHGSSRERLLYNSMTSASLVRRLIKNRPLAFYNPRDKTVLRDGTKPPGRDWELVGSNREGRIHLHNYLTYDEIQVGALLGVSSPTFFINAGARHNEGEVGRAGSFEPEGVMVGLVGARFKKEGKMESQHMIVSGSLSRREFGYGVEGVKYNPVAAANLEFFAALYSQPSPSASRFYFPSYEEAVADRSGKFHRLANGAFFNIAAYKARIRVSIECLLVEANARAQEGAGKMAYVFVVGLGLGLWMECKQQARWFVDVVGESLQSISLPYVADVDLNWFPNDVKSCGGARSGQTLTSAAGNQIAIHFTTRSPADRLPPSDPPKLLVVSYAWDGNAFPGNEYWNGLLSSSGDSAAACCSTIVELQNAWINAGFLDRHHLIQPVRSTA